MNEISTAQQASWNKFSTGWRKWDAQTMAFLAPHGEAIIAHLKPSGSARILDIAAGTGEPGLRMARMLSGGSVVLTDLSDGMLQVARDKAAQARITNVQFQQADACELPFEDSSFDAVSCRLGYMFFPDMQSAAREAQRVLKPGGRFATTVWGGPEQNFWITCMVQGIKKHIELPPQPPGSPGMFRCAQPGLISNLLTMAGFKAVAECEVRCQLDCGGAEGYWNMMTEVAAPFVAALSGADASTVAKVKAEVLASMHERHPQGAIDARGRLIVGAK